MVLCVGIRVPIIQRHYIFDILDTNWEKYGLSQCSLDNESNAGNILIILMKIVLIPLDQTTRRK